MMEVSPARTARCYRASPSKGEARLGESLAIVECVMTIGVQMAHDMGLQAGGDGGNCLDENGEQQAE